VTATARPLDVPHDADAERAVLGCVLLEGRAALSAVATLEPEDFFFEWHRTVFAAMQDLTTRDEAIDLITLADALRRADQLEAIGGPAALTLLIEQASLAANLSSYVAIVREHATKRRLLQLAMRTSAQATNGAASGTILDALTQEIAAIQVRANAATAAPRAIGAHALMTAVYTQRPAIVGAGVVIREGIALLGAHPKRGKTALMLQLVICRALGLPWLGFETTPGVTLYFNAEIPDHALQARLRLMKPEGEALPDEGLAFVTARGLHVDTTDGRQTVRHLIEQARPDLVVFDPLARFVSGDENSSRDAGRLVAGLDELVQAFGVAFVLVDHLAKPAPGDAREGGLKLRGSSALFAAADSILMLDRESDGHFRLSFELRHAVEREPMLLERDAHLWFTVAGPAEDLVSVAAVVDTIGLRYTGLKNALMQDADVKERTAERLIAKARKAGLIGLDDGGLYRATDKYRHVRHGGESTS
jgi:hypothetical protein